MAHRIIRRLVARSIVAIALVFVGAPLAQAHTRVLGATNVPGAELHAVATQRDGKILAVGRTATRPVRLLVTRLMPSGAFDRGFNRGRPVLGPVGSGAEAVAVQRDGKIVVAGSLTDATGIGVSGILVERLTPGGGLDRRFGSGGRVTLLTGPARGAANALTLTARGQIVVGGSATGANGFPRALFVRLTPAGRLDRSFGRGGIDLVDYGRYSVANAVAVLPNGQIIFAGSQRDNLQSTVLLAGRLQANGRPDGPALIRQFARGAGFSAAFGLVLQPHGAVVIAGAAADASLGSVTLLLKLNGSGRLDGGFGAGGVVRIPAAQNPTQCCGEDQQPGASAVTVSGADIVAGGFYDTDGRARSALWAVRGNGRVDSGFGSAGRIVAPLTGADSEIRGVAVAGKRIVTAGFMAAPFTTGSGFVDRVG